MKEVSAGGVVFRGDEVLLIQDAFGRATFPKGLLEPGETAEEAALREIEEETGIRGVLRAELGTTSYIYRAASRGKINKLVHYYLVEAVSGQLTPQLEEIASAQWVKISRAGEILRDQGYENNRVVFSRALRAMSDL